MHHRISLPARGREPRGHGRRCEPRSQLPVGYSDHTDGFEISLAAVALGATIIEKHLTLDRKAEGPDHAASLEPDDFARMVSAIRNIEGAIGDGIKTPKNSEIRNMPIARKSLVAARSLKAGETIGANDIASKRPGSGRPPIEYWSLIGTTAARFLSPTIRFSGTPKASPVRRPPRIRQGMRP